MCIRDRLGGGQFEALARGVDFEDVTSGRVGNQLVDVGELGVPLVRTTTQYTRPAHRFSGAHREVAEAIRRVAGEALSFDNALIEIYDRAYFKMGYHSDQALDLAPGSHIALYSCYERPDSRASLRTLEVKDKATGEQTSIVLEHDSVVWFSLETNTRYAHKIVLDPVPSPRSPEPDNRWLGLTLRKSRTHVRFDDGLPRFADGAPLVLADEAQRKAFYRLRGQENRSMEFTYPRLDYTISAADMLAPVG